MPRLQNKANGVIVNVDDATAAEIGSEWVDPAAAPEPKRPAKTTTTAK